MKKKKRQQFVDFGLPSLVMWGGDKARRLHVAVSTHEGKAIDLRGVNVSVSCFHPDGSHACGPIPCRVIGRRGNTASFKIPEDAFAPGERLICQVSKKETDSEAVTLPFAVDLLSPTRWLP